MITFTWIDKYSVKKICQRTKSERIFPAIQILLSEGLGSRLYLAPREVHPDSPIANFCTAAKSTSPSATLITKGGRHFTNLHATINNKSAWTIAGESVRARGWGGMCGGAPCRRFSRRIKSTKIKREGDGGMAVGGRHQTGRHNTQLTVGVGRGRDIGEGAQLRRNVWGGAFCNRLAAANQAPKNIKIKIRRVLRWLQNDMKNATINQK